MRCRWHRSEEDDLVGDASQLGIAMLRQLDEELERALCGEVVPFHDAVGGFRWSRGSRGRRAVTSSVAYPSATEAWLVEQILQSVGVIERISVPASTG